MNEQNDIILYGRNPQEIVSAVITSADDGAVYIHSDFSDIADPASIRVIFSRLEQSGALRRILPGVYEHPRYSRFLKEYAAADPVAVANALARKHGWRTAPSGATALNLLKLSTQVPGKYEFVSDGPYREFIYDNTILTFKHTANKELSGLSDTTALVVQALKSLGKQGVTPEIIRKIASILSDGDKIKMLSEAKYTTAWIYEIIKKVAGKRLYEEYLKGIVTRPARPLSQHISENRYG